MSANMTPAQLLASEPIDAVIQVLRERCSWPLMKRLLASKNLKPGGGWPDLRARAAKGDLDAQTINDLARRTYAGSILAGNRYVRLHELDPNVVTALWSRISTHVIPSSIFRARYPLPLVGSALDGAPSAFTLCEIRKTGSDIQFVFCSKQVIEESLTIDATSTPTVMSTFSQQFGIYDRFVAYKHTSIQCFDVVSLRPQLGRLEVALDLSKRSTEFEGDTRALALLFHVTLFLPELRPLVDAQQPTNLFPAIAEIYKSAANADTNIVDIGFRTPSGAVNRGKMPSTSEDIREEPFHKAGSERVDKKINPHGIVVAWAFSFPSGGARVKLWTSAAKSMVPIPSLWGLEIADTSADSDIVQALNKVSSYL